MAEDRFRIPGQEGYLRVRSGGRIMGRVRLEAVSTCMNGRSELWMIHAARSSLRVPQRDVSHRNKVAGSERFRREGCILPGQSLSSQFHNVDDDMEEVTNA